MDKMGKLQNVSAADFVQVLHKKRTIFNWKKNLGVEIPLEKFESFKQHKKTYMMLSRLDPELVRMFCKFDEHKE